MIHALLTVDDISSRNTPAMVDYLKEKGIKAIFFATGRNVEQFYQEALYAVKSGMIIGNHSYSHPYFSKISLDACMDEIERCEQILDKLYQDSDVERVYRPFRFPYGDKGGKNRDDLQKYFKEKGFHKVDDTRIPHPWWHEHGLNRDIDTFWTFDFEEYKIRPASGFTLESVWKKIYDEHPQKGAALLAQESRHILLLHAHDETEQMLPAYYRLFIDELLKHGMVFDEPAFL